MNKAIAYILKEQLNIPLIQKKAGLVQVAEYQDTLYDETGTVPTTFVKRIPLSQDVAYDPNVEQPDLVPDENKTGILYFEDKGITPLVRKNRLNSYRSHLRCVVWLNTKTIATPNRAIVPVLANKIIGQLQELNHLNIDPFLNLRVSVEGLPKQDAAIFAAYTYDSFNTGYTMPPYEYFAIDLSVEYSINPACVIDLTLV